MVILALLALVIFGSVGLYRWGFRDGYQFRRKLTKKEGCVFSVSKHSDPYHPKAL